MSILAMLPMKVLRATEIGTGKTASVLVDGDYDGEYFAQYQWRVLPSGYVIQYYTYRSDISEKTGEFLRMGSGSGRIVYLHNLILPPKKKYWVTHINGNKLDNRSANLKYITPSESAVNRKRTKRQTNKNSLISSRYSGVQRQATSPEGKLWVSPNRWVAACRGKYLGSFGNEEEAARAYDKRAYENWGDRAVLNFPKGDKEA